MATKRPLLSLRIPLGWVVIFGFNTDVKYGETVYHVQSEAREHELLLQTLVFVKGRCIGKRAASYADMVPMPGFSEQHLHELLKAQHKSLVAAAREGLIEAKLNETAPASEAVAPAADPAPAAEEISVPAAAPAAEPGPAVASQPAAAAWDLQPISGVMGKGLSLECLPPASVPDGSEVIVFVKVSDDSGPAIGAEVSCRITSAGGPALYAYSISGDTGVADVSVGLEGLDLASVALLIRISHLGRSVSRKYQLRQA